MPPHPHPTPPSAKTNTSPTPGSAPDFLSCPEGEAQACHPGCSIPLSFSLCHDFLAGTVSRANPSPIALILYHTQAIPIPLWWWWTLWPTHIQWL